jgi:uncharacterized protein (DUF2267 family)
MSIRGIYYDGWDPSRVPRKMQLIQTVLHSLRHHVTDGEWEVIKASLPKELRAVLT